MDAAVEAALAESPIKTQSGHPVRWWDDGFGPLWVYRETLGVLGVVRAQTWESAWECVVDEIMDGCAWEDLEPEEQADFENGQDVEGVYFRSSGEPSSPWAKGEYAREDLNGCSLDRLTVGLAMELGLKVGTDFEL